LKSPSCAWVPGLAEFILGARTARTRGLARDTKSAPDFVRARQRQLFWRNEPALQKGNKVEQRGRAECHFDAESIFSSARASCTVVMNCAGKMMVEFFSVEISAMVWSVRS